MKRLFPIGNKLRFYSEPPNKSADPAGKGGRTSLKKTTLTLKLIELLNYAFTEPSHKSRGDTTTTTILRDRKRSTKC